MTRLPEDNTPPDAPHAPGTDTDPHRGEVSEARPDLLRRLLDILGWESGTEEQAIEALAGAVRSARGDRTHRDVYQQRNEAWELVVAARQQRNEAQAECERLRRELLSFELENVQLKAECERLRRELRAAREAVGEGWFGGGATLAEAIRRKVHSLEVM